MGSVLDWNGTVELNGTEVNFDTLDFSTLQGPIQLHLLPKGFKRVNAAGNNTTEGTTQDMPQDNTQYRIKVRAWMTKATEPGSDFTFMKDLNNNIPMPMRVMVGYKVKETPRMVRMVLHGEITEKVTQCCMQCGRRITNPVSKLFGMGPECGGHNYVSPFDTEEELRAAVNSYNERLRKVVWEGWIAKSAIEEEEVFTGVDKED